MKILHTADLHIDSPMKGLERYEGAPVEYLRSSTRNAVQNIVDLAISEDVDVVTIGGDVFDGDWTDINTGLWWNRQLDRLTSEGIEVYVVHGNHDAHSRLTHHLPTPSGVTVFGTDGPSTVESAELPLAVHGQSYHDRVESRDLASSFPEPIPGRFNVGLLHTSLDGRPGHAPYAPTSIDALRLKNYELWALGHVHNREEVKLGSSVALFPGNPQGRNIRELGPRGVSIITTNGTSIDSIVHHDVDVARWGIVDIDVSEISTIDEVVNSATSGISSARSESGRPLAVRIVLTGASPIHSNLLDQLATVRGTIITKVTSNEGDVWIEKLINNTRRVDDVEEADAAAIEAIRRIVMSALEDGETFDRLNAELTPLRNKLAPVIGRFDEEFKVLMETSGVSERLPQIADALVHRLGKA